MKNCLCLRFPIVLFSILLALPVFSQKELLRNDSMAIRDSIRDLMFHGALLSMDALQAKYESQKRVDLFEKQQKEGESQNLFFQSRAYYRKAISLDKNYYPAWTNMGTTYFMQELPKAAIPCYKKAISINGFYSPAWYNLGKAYDMISMNDSAVYAFKQCIRTDSSNVTAYQELSRIVMMKNNDSAAALKLLRLASHYKPASEVPWVSMASIYFTFNDSAKAISSLEKAAEIYSGDIKRLEKLANYFQRHNDVNKAAYYSNLVAIEKKKMEIPPDTGN